LDAATPAKIIDPYIANQVIKSLLLLFLLLFVRVFLPEFHPAHVLHLMKMGKLRLYIGPTADLQQALRELTEAQRLTAITFGSKSVLNSKVKEMIAEAQIYLSTRTLM